jgi:hypothetical protein
MNWQVVMDEDGGITLPADLIAELGWTPETALIWSDDGQVLTLGPSSASDTAQP